MHEELSGRWLRRIQHGRRRANIARATLLAPLRLVRPARRRSPQDNIVSSSSSCCRDNNNNNNNLAGPQSHSDQYSPSPHQHNAPFALHKQSNEWDRRLKGCTRARFSAAVGQWGAASAPHWPFARLELASRRAHS